MEPESKAPNDGQDKRATEYLTNECTFVGVDQNQHFDPNTAFPTRKRRNKSASRQHSR